MEEDEKIREQIYKEIKFQEHVMPEKCCSNCYYSYCPNPGANIPALSCKMIKHMGNIASSHDYLFAGVVDEEAVCRLWIPQTKKK